MENNLPQRKQIRLKEYDYSQEGYYFITICTKNRKCILSEIKGDNVNKNCRGRRPRRPANTFNQYWQNCRKIYTKL